MSTSERIMRSALAARRRAVFVVPRRVLIEQTVKVFEREGLGPIGVIQGDHTLTDPAAPVQIASAQTLIRRGFLRVDIAIIDEAHQFESIRAWLNAPEWSTVPFVGLTATPLSRGLGKDYKRLIQPVDIQTLIDRGFLSFLGCLPRPAQAWQASGRSPAITIKPPCPRRATVENSSPTSFRPG